MSRDLEISLPGRRVGELSQTSRTGDVRWLPDAGWESEGQHPRLGAEFLRKPGPRPGVPGLPNWFENLLPERKSDLRRRLCGQHRLRIGQSFDLLRVLGRDLIGAVEARAEGLPDIEGEAPSDLDLVEGEEAFTAALPRMSGLAGMQLKFSMSMVGDRLVLPVHGSGGEWIVKFPGEYERLAEIEHATMGWAKAAGFSIPHHFLASATVLSGVPADWIGNSPIVFVIRRFDRTQDGGKIHQEDLCQALDLPPANKYDDAFPRVSFDGALRFVTDLCGEEDGRELARRMGFAIASGNGDAHLKNWSLVWGGLTRPRLAPCYDLVCTIAWEDRLGWRLRGGPNLALTLGGVRAFGRLDEAALDALVKKSSQFWAAEELMAGIGRARDTWGSQEGTVPEVMRRAIDEHWKEVPLLRRVGLKR